MLLNDFFYLYESVRIGGSAAGGLLCFCKEVYAGDSLFC
ncbi:MAG: hypothetical protein EOM03_17655 [Clostridia bacterium]|nr:hypothetical protein [Clostridia bacterium]